MSDKAMLCYICGWSHGSLHVYSLDGGLVPGKLLEVWLVDIIVLLMKLQTPNFLQIFISSIGKPMLSPKVICKHLPLSLSGSDRAPQETAISDSCQKVLLGIYNSAWVG